MNLKKYEENMCSNKTDNKIRAPHPFSNPIFLFKCKEWKKDLARFVQKKSEPLGSLHHKRRFFVFY